MYVALLTQPSQAVFGTSHARLFRVHAYVHRGEHHLAHALYSEARGLLRRWFAAAPAGHTEAITSLAVGPCQDDALHVLLYALSARTVQVWRVPLAGSGAAANHAKLLVADDQLHKTIASRALYARGARYSAAASAHLSLLAAAPLGEARAVALYADRSGEQTVAYGLALVSVPTDGALTVHQVVPLEYAAPADPRPGAAPRLDVSPSAPHVACISFDDALVTQLLSDTAGTVEETLYLKPGANRVLGACLVPVHDRAHTIRWAAQTSASGVLLVDMDVSQAEQLALDQQPSSPQMHASRIARLQERLEKVVWFGEDASNPLQLDALPATLDTGLLQAAAENLSRDLVQGTLACMPPSVDLRTALGQRVACAKRLIGLIGQNGYLMQLSKTSRFQLRCDAELLAGASDLWRFYDDSVQSGATAHVLPAAIHAALGQSDAHDAERHFFERDIDRTPRLLEALLARVAHADAPAVVETTRLVLALRFGAARFRAEHGEAYALEAAPPVPYEPWFAHASSIELLETLFRATLPLLQRPERSTKPAIKHAELRTQLCALAEFAMDTYDARVAFLDAAARDDTSDGAAPALDATRDAYDHARPALLHPLMEIGRADKAFALAEQHHDYKTLTELCFAEVREGSGKRAKHAHPALHEPAEVRVEEYLDRYGMPFADELYQYYIQHGAYRKLFEPQPEHATLVVQFLDAHPQYSRMAWIQDVLLSRFDRASDVLQRCAKGEREDIRAKHAMLSLGKLAQLATLPDLDAQLADASEQATLEAWDDALDLVHVQKRLQHKWLDAALLPNAQPEVVAERVAQTVAPQLAERPAVRAVFVMLATLLLSGQVASGEDMMDMLALQDASYAVPADAALSDFAIAAQVYVRIDVSRERKEAALALLWRRLYLQDDWYALSATAQKTDEGVLSEVRSTVAFATIQAVLANESTAPVLLSPEQACAIPPPSVAMLAERFSGLPAAQLEQLHAALQDEHAALATCVHETKLGAFFAQVLAQPVPDDAMAEDREELADEVDEDAFDTYRGQSVPGGAVFDEPVDEEALV